MKFYFFSAFSVETLCILNLRFLCYPKVCKLYIVFAPCVGMGMAEEILIESASGERISALVNQPDEVVSEGGGKTLVLMIHGYPGQKNSHNDFFGDLEALLAESGFHTVRFDFRGCGQSDGQSEQFTLHSACEDFKNMLLWAKTQGYERFGYIAEGFGASLALLNLTPETDFLVLAWPILDPLNVFEFYFVKDVKPSGAAPSQGQKISQSFVDSLKATDYSKALASVDVPMLILHGVKDERVPIDQLELIRKHFKGPRAEITTFEDGGHGLTALAHRKMVFHHVKGFVLRYARPPQKAAKRA